MARKKRENREKMKTISKTPNAHSQPPSKLTDSEKVCLQCDELVRPVAILTPHHCLVLYPDSWSSLNKPMTSGWSGNN